jgi:nickel/cobalt exporter
MRHPEGAMLEGALYLVSSFWLGAVHAATPGHGKTVSAAYLVGARGRPTDALALGIFVTLAHTSGIILFALIAALGSTVLSQRSESYVALATALLMVGVGAWMLLGAWRQAGHTSEAGHAHEADHAHQPDHDRLVNSTKAAHAPAVAHAGLAPAPAAQAQAHRQADEAAHHHPAGRARVGVHRHGWGLPHSHAHHVALGADTRPSWGLLLGLGLAGGLLPDPAALAVLLAALASGKLVLGLLTVLVFSLGFASVLVLVGALVGQAGRLALGWFNERVVQRLQLATAGVIVLVGSIMTLGAWQQLATLQ